MSQAPVKKAATSAFRHFQFIFERLPKPNNTTSLAATDFIAQDPTHPLHIPVRRRHSDFDPYRLHWAVRCPVALCRKRAVRSWVTRRVRDAFLAELATNGLDRWGVPLHRLDSPPAGAGPARHSVVGAARLQLQDSVLVAPISEIRADCRLLLQRLVKLQYNSRRQNTNTPRAT
ncbi:hypothetical protein MBLNU459_g1818t1 [Dothideomycetes sp. NU459]